MVAHGLLLLVLGTAAGADTGGSWGMMAATRGEGRRLEHSRVSGCWRKGNWQQAAGAEGGSS